MLMPARPSCNTTKAQAPACHAQATHSALLPRNTQNPRALRVSFSDATSHAASSVISMAGHCNASSHGRAESITLKLDGRRGGCWLCALRQTSMSRLTSASPQPATRRAAVLSSNLEARRSRQDGE